MSLPCYRVLQNGRHAAFAEYASVEDLVCDLEEMVSKGLVYCRHDPKTNGRLRLYGYAPKCMFMSSRTWTMAMLVSRGLVIDHELMKIAALPFPKFFNYGEVCVNATAADDISLNDIDGVYSKEDGSLGIVYFCEATGSWRVNTRGSFHSAQATWAQAWWNEHLSQFETALSKDITYLVEIIYPENRVILKYEWSGLCILGGFNRTNGLEVSVEELKETFNRCQSGMRFPTVFENIRTVSEILAAMKDPARVNEEGFVVRLKGGFRFKAKLDWYMDMVRLSRDITPKSLWKSYMETSQLSFESHQASILMEVDEELHNDVLAISKILKQKFDEASTRVLDFHDRTRTMTAKDLGLATKAGDIPTDISKILFIVKRFNLELTPEILWTDARFRTTLFQQFEGQWDGYTPTTGATAFLNLNQ